MIGQAQITWLTWLALPKDKAVDRKDSCCPIQCREPSHTQREVQSVSDEDTVGRKVEGTVRTTEQGSDPAPWLCRAVKRGRPHPLDRAVSCLGKAKLEGSREREQKSPATTEKLSRAAMTNCRMCGTDRNRPWSSRKRAGAVLLMHGRESQSESELSFEGQRERAEETASR